MVPANITSFFQSLMDIFEVIFYELNTIVIINLTLFVDVTFLTFNAHSILRDETFNISIVFTKICQDIINSFFINFPTMIRVHFSIRNFIIIKEVIWNDYIVCICFCFRRLMTMTVILIYPETIYGIILENPQILIFNF